MRLAHSLHLSTRSKRLQSILPDGLQHQQARLFALLLCLEQQAFVDERCGSFQYLYLPTGTRNVYIALRYGGDCFECAAAHEDREVTEKALLFFAQEIVAPLDGLAQCLLARGKVACTAGQDVETMGEAIQQSLRKAI